MAFSRMAKSKAAPARPASDDKAAEIESSPQDEARKRAIEEAKKKAIEQDSRWKENYAEMGAAMQQRSQNVQPQAPIDEEKARQERIERSKAEAAKRATAQGGFGGAPGGGGFGSGSKSGFSWKKQTPEPVAAKGAAKGGAGGAKLPSYDSVAASTGAAPTGLPNHDDCEQAISAMISRTVQGMKEGLQQLGLPDYPLHFIPGKELNLCGHDCREVINEMIHAWMTEEKEEFYKVLKRIKLLVANPIITEEEMEWMSPQERAAARATASAAPAAADDNDDEVVDLPAKGTDRPAAPKTFEPPTAPKPAPAQVAKQEIEDYYSLLGVEPKATLQEIRLKFRQLVVTEHPEKGGDPKKFAKLNKAYSVLSDIGKRKAFDEQRAEALEAKLVD